MSVLAEGFGAQQQTGAGILFLCVVVGVAMALARRDDDHR